jgi:leucine dehydrogenase
VRVRAYPSAEAALAEAQALARAMTRKAALADIPCGGAKVVVNLQPGADRAETMALLGERVERFAGKLWIGPDYGFTEEDRLVLASRTRYVDDPGKLGDLDATTALGVREAIAAALGRATLKGARIGIVGIGKVGGKLLERLVAEGAEVLAYDIDPARFVWALEHGATAVPEEEILLSADLDAIAPCALGGWITEDLARRVRTRAIAGAANDVLASPQAGRILHAHGIPLVPDLIANAGAAAHWAAVTLEGATPQAASERARLIGPRAAAVLAAARARNVPPTELAITQADEIAAAWA